MGLAFYTYKNACIDPSDYDYFFHLHLQVFLVMESVKTKLWMKLAGRIRKEGRKEGRNEERKTILVPKRESYCICTCDCVLERKRQSLWARSSGPEYFWGTTIIITIIFSCHRASIIFYSIQWKNEHSRQGKVKTQEHIVEMSLHPRHAMPIMYIKEYMKPEEGNQTVLMLLPLQQSNYKVVWAFARE